MKTAIKYRELSAGEITSSAIRELQYRGCKVWRQNNLAVKGRKFTGERGQSDIIGYVKATGLFVACEVKKNGDTFKPEQIGFLMNVQVAGGISMVACQEGSQVTLINFKDYKP